MLSEAIAIPPPRPISLPKHVYGSKRMHRCCPIPHPPSPQGERGAAAGVSATLLSDPPSPSGRGAGGEGSDLPDAWCIQLGQALKSLPIIQNLLRTLEQTPPTYADLIEKLGRSVGLTPNASEDYQHLLLDSLLSLIATARRRVQTPSGKAVVLPWVNLRVQYWFRELRRMVASVEAQPRLLFPTISPTVCLILATRTTQKPAP